LGIGTSSSLEIKARDSSPHDKQRMEAAAQQALTLFSGCLVHALTVRDAGASSLALRRRGFTCGSTTKKLGLEVPPR
jgi:hypothetical protein